MPGKETDSGRSSAVGSSSSKIAAEADVGFEWDSSRDSPQEWNGGESMRSGSGRSLASMGSKGDTNSVAESTASGGNSASIEVGKEVKEKKDKSSWVKTIGMRTLRLRKKDKDPEKSQSRISISSALGSLERPGKSKSKNKSEKQVKGDDDSISTASASGAATTSKPGEHVKDNDSIYSGASSKNGSVTREVLGGSVSVSASAAAGENADKQDPARFLGEGLLFKGKLIGVLEVSGPRGDRICQEALSELKMAVKAAGEHKQKITIHIALDGLRIRDEKTGDCLYHHQVHKISFIAQDLTDARAFGYIFGSPDTGHRFFGIKTEKSASQVVIAMRDLFQVVFDLKKKEIERAKQQLEMQQKFLATRAAETAPTTKTEPKFSIAETYIEGAGAVGGASLSTGAHPSAPAEVDLLNLEVELNSLQEGLDNIHTNLGDSVPFRGSTASISSDPMNPMPKLSTGSMASASNANNPTPVSNSAVVGDPFGDSFHPFDSGAAPSFHTSSRINMKHGLSDQPLPLGSSQLPPYSSNTTPITFTSDPFAQIDPFPGPKFHGEGDFFNSDPFDSPSGQFSFSFPNESASKLSIIGNSTEKIEESLNESRISNEAPREAVSARSMGPREKHADGWVASFEDDFVPDSEANGQADDQSKTELDIFTELDPLGTGRIRPFVDRKDFFQHLKNPPKKNLKDLGALENLTPHSSSSSLVAESSNVAHASMTGLNVNASTNEITPPKVQFTDISSIPNSFSTNFTSSQTGEMDVLPLKTPPTSASSRSSSIRLRLHSENSRSDSPPNYSPPPPPHGKHFSSTSSIGSAAGAAATNSEYMSGSQLPFLPPPSSMLGTPPNSRFANKKSPQLLKQMTIAGSTATTATSSPKTLPRPSSGRERKLTADSQSSIGIDDIPNLTPPPRPPHSHTSNTLGKSVSLSTAVPRPSSGSDRLRNLSGMSSLSGNIMASAGIVPPEPPPRPLQTTTISSNFSQQLSPALVSPPPPLPPKKQTFSTVQSSPLNLFPSKPTPTSDFSKSIQKISASESNDLPLPLPSRKPQFSSNTQSVGGRYSVPLASMSPSMQRRDDPELKLTSTTGSGNPPVIKLTMKQALHQVASLSLGDLANKLELPVEKLSSLTIQQLAEKLTLMDYEEKMEQKERELSKLSSSSNRDISCNSRQAAAASSGFQLGFEDDFSTASAPADLADLKKEKEEFDKYAVFRELSIEDASGFSITGNAGSSKLSEFSANSEDEDMSRTMDKTLTNKDSSSERTIQADGTGETNHTNKDASFATAMANTMDDITDANLSDDDGKFPFDEDEDISPSSNFNAKPTEWATFESNFEDPFATTSLVKAADVDGNGSPWDSEEGGDNSQKTPPVPAPSENPADKFDFEPFQKPSQPTVTNYSLAEVGSSPQVPPVPERRRPSRENGGLQQQQSQPLSPDLLRSPVSQFHRQSSGSSKHSGKSIEEPSIGGKGSDYSESGRPRRRRGSVDEEGRWERERERDRDTYSRRRGDRENFGRSDSRDSYSSIPRGKYREGRGVDSEEEYVPSKSSVVRKGRSVVVRPSSSKRSSEREGEPDDDKEEDEDTRSYASYHSNYSASGPRKHRRLPPKYHHHHYSSSQRRRERDRERPPGTTQGAGSGHSSISPERYSHHESDFDDSYEEENGGSRKKDLYLREREYAERHYLRSRPSSGGGYHSSKRYSPRHSDPYYRDRERYYRGERSRRNEYEEGNGREFSECSGDEDRYHGRHGSHRRRHRGRDEYYRDREREPRRHHYYTNSPSWDSDSGPETAGERSEKGHRPSSAKYGSEHGNSSRHSPPPGSSSSRPTSGRREPAGTHKSPHTDHSVSGNGHGSNHAKKQSGSSKMREYRFDERFSGEAFAAKLEQLDRDYSNDVATRKDEDADSTSEPLSNVKRQSPVKSETLTPVDQKLSQPQSPFEDNFVIPPNTNGTDGDEKACEDLQEAEEDGNDDVEISPENEVEGKSSSSKKSRHKQIFFPTKFESEDGEGDDENVKNVASKLEDNQAVENNHDNEDRDETPSPDLSITPPTSTTSLRGNFSVYSTKRLESIRSEEEKSNEDSVSESALTNNASNMKKSDSFNIFQAPTQDPFADDDFFN